MKPCCNGNKQSLLLTYNKKIKSMAESKKWRKILSIFHILKSENMSPDKFTYPLVLKATVQLHNLHEGRKTHAAISKSPLQHNTHVCNSLIHMYSHLSPSMNSSATLFLQTPSPDVVTFNLLISGFLHHSMFHHSLLSFRHLLRSSLRPDQATILPLLSLSSSLHNLPFTKQLHLFSLKFLHLPTNIPLSNSLISLYSSFNLLTHAATLFQSVQHHNNLMCSTTMISAYAKSGLLTQARHLFDTTPSKDVVLFTAMINGYIQYNKVEEAIKLFREMQNSGIKPDKYTLVSLLTGFSKMAAIEEGRWVHRYIINNHLGIDVVVGTALVDMYCRNGHLREAMEVFNKVEGGRDAALCTSLLCGMGVNGEGGRALEILKKMEKDGIKADEITIIGALNACSHGGMVEEGWEVLKNMGDKYGVERKGEHYACVVDMLGRRGMVKDAERVAEIVEEEEEEGEEGVEMVMCGCLMRGCGELGEVGVGEKVWRRRRSSSFGSLMGNGYARVGRWGDVERVRREMREKGVRKEGGGSCIVVEGVVCEFLVGSLWDHPLASHIYFMLHLLSKMLH